MLFFCVKEEYRQRLLCITRTCLLGNPQKNSLIQISLIISHHLFKPLLQKVWNLHYKWMLLLAKMLCRRQKRRKTSENGEQFKSFLTILLNKKVILFQFYICRVLFKLCIRFFWRNNYIFIKNGNFNESNNFYIISMSIRISDLVTSIDSGRLSEDVPT